MNKKTLLVVESPKNARHAGRCASTALGEEVSTFATKGHLFDLHPHCDGRDALWVPVNPYIVERLGHEAQRASRIIVASDPDQEGERIAMSARAICQQANPQASIERAPVSAWTADGFRASLGASFNEALAQRGDTRRLADRIIGWTHGNPGRVRAQIIAGWLASPPPETFGATRVSPPPNFAALARAAGRYGFSVGETTDLLARYWMDGATTYPRTDGEQLSDDARRLAHAICVDMGLEPSMEGPLPGFEGSHEALLPLTDPRKEGSFLGVLRELVGHSMARTAPEFLDAQYQEGDPMPTDLRWLEVAAREGLGRPGTWASHIAGLEMRGISNEHGIDVRRAHRSLGKLPESFRNPQAHRHFDASLDNPAPLPERTRESLLSFGLDVPVRGGFSWDCYQRYDSGTAHSRTKFASSASGGSGAGNSSDSHSEGSGAMDESDWQNAPIDMETGEILPPGPLIEELPAPEEIPEQELPASLPEPEELQPATPLRTRVMTPAPGR